MKALQEVRWLYVRLGVIHGSGLVFVLWLFLF